MLFNWDAEEIAELLGGEPLAQFEGVEGYLRILDYSSLSAIDRECVASALQHTSILRAFLNGIRECALVDGGGFISKREKTNLREVLNSLAEPHLMPLREGGIEFVVNVNSDVPSSLNLDYVTLSVITTNLISTAMNLAPNEIRLEGRLPSEARANLVSISLTCFSCSRYADVTRDGERGFRVVHKSPDFVDLGFSLAQKLAQTIGGNTTIRKAANKVTILLELPASESLDV